MRKYNRCPKPAGTQPALPVVSGYFRIEPAQPNIFADATLSEIVSQLERCDYRCEAGPLRLNLAFIELKRRAEAE
jgi:hypothetical protein